MLIDFLGISEPLYIHIEKDTDTKVTFHFVFLALTFLKKRSESKTNEKRKNKKITFKSYISAWLKLRKRVKIKIDALYFPIISSQYTKALLCGLFPAILEGEKAYADFDETSFAVHIETTLPDCLILYLKALRNERSKERV